MKRRIIFLDIDGTLTEPGKNNPPDSALRAIREARAAGHLVYLCSYTDEGFKDFLKKHAGEGSNSEMLRWREQIESSLHIQPMTQYRGQPVYKIVMMAEDRRQLDEPQQVLEEDFFFSIPQGGRFGFVDAELVNSRFDKGKGVVRVCERMGIPVEDSIGFGDSINDREMLQTVGLSVCMANGSEEVKKMADEVCPAVTEDGLYQAFLRHGLCGES